MSHSEHQPARHSLAASIEKEIGVFAQKCYQCGKCSAGCPVNEEMDYPPSVVMRLLQSESVSYDETLLKSYSIWMCVACEMCLTRCPYEIDIPSAMDFMRQKSLKENKVHPKARPIVSFHESFLNSIKTTGRLFEFGLILDYKRKTLNLMQDVALAPKMISRGKLHFIPEKIKGTSHIKQIFAKTIHKPDNQKKS